MPNVILPDMFGKDCSGVVSPEQFFLGGVIH
jgi:hypothetical protein